MASQANSTNSKPPAPRRTKTIGTRLTAAEIDALDQYIVTDGRDLSRAGMIATLAVWALVGAKLLPPDHCGG